MKKITISAAAIIVMTACIGANNRNAGQEVETAATQTETRAETAQNLTVDRFAAVAAENLGKQVVVTGTVKHTCKHSGKRCFIVDENGGNQMRVEAKGEIGGFNRELIGSKITVSGTVRESKLTAERIAKMEAELAAKQESAPVSGEACADELTDIAEIKAWMAANGKDYYPIYYLDGEKFEVVE